ncbi:N-acetylmuramoyl-L-alanine amidase [Lacticaseibacillus pabuli]|uniref:N-acetylmuramoyl-L-alanine amidase n=1 Tax=Lacticaseibacillus pabuli TaxID=3025672 RepID=A0ABY7WTI1_9LACO|nr:N-acetylmuramoyl-L-alanine amidase [Lacticaseibacillus sp. KACC 23028]WDF83104.1 N-acetylmuramoyl-L-alanine amidase [Lacticaseibacillus sp. KACC 23028]
MKKKWALALTLAAGLAVGGAMQMQHPQAATVNQIAAKYKPVKVTNYKSNFPYKKGYRQGVGRPEGIIIHETAEPTWTAADGAKHFLSEWKTKQTYVHAFVDGSEVAHIGDTNYQTWGAGTAGNARFISIELCETTNPTTFAKSVNNLAYYSATLLRQYNLKPDLASNDGFGTIWSHYDVTRFLGGTDHTDPLGYFSAHGYDMNQFFALVQKWYGQLGSVKPQASAKNANVVKLGAVTGMYTQPTYNSKKVKNLAKGSSWRYNSVTVTAGQYWFNIGRNQWIRVGGASKPTMTVKATSTLRNAPSYTGKAIGTLKKGAKYKYGDTRFVNDQLWYNLGGNQWVANGKTSGTTRVVKKTSKTGVINIGPATPLYPKADPKSKPVRTLNPGTSWLYSDVKTVGGKTWYWLGGSQWVQFN